MEEPVQLNDQFESNDSLPYNKGYYQKTPPVGISLTQDMYSKRYSSSSYASSVSDFALTHSPTETSHRESMAAQRQIKDLEKKLNDTLLELERTKKENRESIELNKTHVRRIKQLEQDSEQLKIVNKSLSNDMEIYQKKLVDKENEYKQLETMYYEEKKRNESRSKSISSDDEVKTAGEAVYKESDHTLIEKLQDEIKTLRGDNESMTLYIQKMLNRIMEVDGFEETLATNWTSTSQEKSSKSTKSEKPARPNSLKSDFKFPRSPTSAKTSFATLKEEETTKSDDDESKNNPQQRSSRPLTTFESLNGDNASRTSPPNRTRTGSNSADGALVQESPRYVNLPKRSSTMNVVPTGTANTTNSAASSKRISGFFKWSVAAVATATMRNAAEAAKKEDPYMKPILLVQAKDKAKD
ncbi:2410_t:CDS:2 [Acaulospora morrowiae]|uniref:2410_t:CDS:1 n=1 Tax=Acaulospora morrowiae TaxID=94023 RepID=A0A9N8WIY2_9GLOM|nr:2410_t:CDS:2 [Acaulospora morrowiae]